MRERAASDAGMTKFSRKIKGLADLKNKRRSSHQSDISQVGRMIIVRLDRNIIEIRPLYSILVSESVHLILIQHTNSARAHW